MSLELVVGLICLGLGIGAVYTAIETEHRIRHRVLTNLICFVGIILALYGIAVLIVNRGDW